MKAFNDMPPELILYVFEKVSLPDLTNVLLVCRQWHTIGECLLFREISYPLARSCSHCKPRSQADTAEIQRLRAIQTLLDPKKALNVRNFSVLGRDPWCGCSLTATTSIQMISFRRLCLATLMAVLMRATNLRSLRFEAITVAFSLRSTSASRLRDLAVCGVDQYWTIPVLNCLQTLDIQLRGRTKSSTISNPALVDFTRLPKLNTLRVEGDVWSGFQDLFTGSSNSVTTCVLRGSLVLNHWLDSFFARLSSSLRYLHCSGVHLIGEISTHFPEMIYLGLHRVLFRCSVFPFPTARLISLSIESDPTDFSNTSLQELNDFLYQALRQLHHSIKHLFLRSTRNWILSRHVLSIIHNSDMELLLLDGVLVLDRLNWKHLVSIARLQVVVRLSCWVDLLQFVPLSTRLSNYFNDTSRSSYELEAWYCGERHRCLAFGLAGLQACSKIYSDLISEEDAPHCVHREATELRNRLMTPSGVSSVCASSARWVWISYHRSNQALANSLHRPFSMGNFEED